MIGLVADTHGNVTATRSAVAKLQERGVDRCIHLGDIGGPQIVREFAAIETDFLWGNNDSDRDALVAACNEVGAGIHEILEITTPAGLLIAGHGHRSDFVTAVQSGLYRGALFGHSHVAMNEMRDGVRMINPGALYRAREYSCALLDPKSLDVEFIRIPKE